MLTTLNNLTFDSRTLFSVQRISCPFAFISISILETHHLRCAWTDFRWNPLPSPQHFLQPLRFLSDPRRSVPESSRARGIRESEPAVNTKNSQTSNFFKENPVPLSQRAPLDFSANLRTAAFWREFLHT